MQCNAQVHPNLTSGSKEKNVRIGSGTQFLHLPREQSKIQT
jgi:hypothetical protein